MVTKHPTFGIMYHMSTWLFILRLYECTTCSKVDLVNRLTQVNKVRLWLWPWIMLSVSSLCHLRVYTKQQSLHSNETQCVLFLHSCRTSDYLVLTASVPDKWQSRSADVHYLFSGRPVMYWSGKPYTKELTQASQEIASLCQGSLLLKLVPLESFLLSHGWKLVDNFLALKASPTVPSVC